MSKLEYIDDATLATLFPSGKLQHPDMVIIDIRSADEYAVECIEGSINIPLDDLLFSDKNKFKDKVILFHCKGGVRTKANEHILEAFNSARSLCLSGGIEQWKKCGNRVKR